MIILIGSFLLGQRRYMFRNKLTTVLAIILTTFFLRGVALCLDCPKMPDQFKKEWEVEVNGAIVKIGPVKGAELKTRTRNVIRDLMGKLPNAARVYLEQMMYATYCSGLRDNRTLTESQKTERLRVYNAEVRKSFLRKVSVEKKVKCRVN